MGMNAEEFAELLAPIQDLPIILFVPEGVYPFEIRAGGQMRIGRAWYLYTGDEAGFVQSMTQSGRHLRTLVDRVIAEQNVDPERRVLLGFSQGGYFAGYLGVKHASRISGLVVMAARIKGEVLEKGQRVRCRVVINLPPGRHVYSAHKKGLGVPTRVDFRGAGYRLGPETGS